MKSIAFLISLSLYFFQPVSAQQEAKEDAPDSAVTAKIMEEGTKGSHVMELLTYISDIYGPRLTGSPAFKEAAEWARNKLASMGLANSHLEGWGPFGRGWQLDRYSATATGRQAFPLHSYPKAWSPGVDDSGEAIHLDAKTDSALETYRGKLGGKFILLSGIQDVKINFEKQAVRHTAADLLELANSDLPRRRRRRRVEATPPDQKARAMVEYKKLLMCQEEGALALLSAGSFDGGSIMVQSASVPSHPDTAFGRRIRIWDPKAPKVLPQIAVGVEHYNRLIRMLQKGERVRIEMNLRVNFFLSDSGYNVIAELPGSDLKDEVVMIGAHLDSWHGATGATDNGTGVAVCMEAMRILKAIGITPRRTIRVALWGGEEQGEYGSSAYVKKHFGERKGRAADPDSKVTLKPAAEKFSVYFNDDNGTGKIRGIYMQGNEAIRPMFRKWFEPLGNANEFTLTIAGTSSTDHESFDNVGLPGFQFIQDDIEYYNRTWHSTQDTYDRAIEDDLKQGAVIMASFAYNAAMYDSLIPRKKQ